jgi:hypothetical protein
MQQRLKKIGLALPAMVLSFNVLAFAPVYAQDGVSGSDDNTTTSTTTETEDNAGSSRKAEARTEAQEKVAELRLKQKTELKDSERQHRCQGRKVGIQNRFTNIVNKSQKIQDKITTIYDKGTTFATTNNLSPTDYDALVAKADAAKATSAADIVALKAATPTIDCNNKDIATSIATFKAAADQVRKDLIAYRTAVHDVLASIRTAAEAAKPADTTEGSTE